MILGYGVIIIGYITWPVVCLIVFFHLKTPLSNFINNIKSVSAGSFGVHTQNSSTNANKFTEAYLSDDNLPTETEAFLSGDNLPTETEEFLSGDNLPTETEEFLSDDNLPAVVVEEKKLIKDRLAQLDLGNEKVEKERLIRDLAFSRIAHNFEIIYGVIFSSQILLLRQLNARKDGIAAHIVENIFNDFKELKPDPLNNFTFNEYVKFLSANQLIKIQENNYFITEMGLEYLKWMTLVGKMEITYG